MCNLSWTGVRGLRVVWFALSLAITLFAARARAQRVGVTAFAEQGLLGVNRGLLFTLGLNLSDRASQAAKAFYAKDPTETFSPAYDPELMELNLSAASVAADQDGLLGPGDGLEPFVSSLSEDNSQPSSTIGASLSEGAAPRTPASGAATPALPAAERSTAGDTSRALPAAQAPSFGFRWSASFLRELIAVALVQQSQSAALIDGAADRARYAGLLPTLTLRAGKNTDRSLRLTPSDGDPDRYQVAGGYDYKLEAQANWELSRLIFATEEVTLGRLRLLLAAAQREVTKQVLAAAARFQRAQVGLSRADLLAEERLGLWLDCAAAEAELEVLSGGWFRRNQSRAFAGAP